MAARSQSSEWEGGGRSHCSGGGAALGGLSKPPRMLAPCPLLSGSSAWRPPTDAWPLEWCVENLVPLGPTAELGFRPTSLGGQGL